MKQSIKVCLFLCMGIYSLHGAAAEASALAEVLFNGVTKGGAKVVKKRPAVHSSSVPLFKNSTVNVQRGGGLKKWSQEFNQRPFHVSRNVKQEFITLEEDADKYFFPPATFVSPLIDIAFKKVFSTPKNSSVIIKLLNEILGLEGEQAIKAIEYYNKEFEADEQDGKVGIVDIYCRDQNNRGFLVEMQRGWDAHFLNRVQNYAAKAFSMQFKRKGVDYETTQPLYCISFVNQVFFPEESDYISHHLTTHQKSHRCYFDKMHYVVIELPKFKKKNGRIGSALDELLYVMKNSKNISQYPGKTYIREIYETLDEKNWNDMELRVATKIKDLAWVEEAREKIYKKAEERANQAEENLRHAEEKAKLAKEEAKAAEEKLRQMTIDTALKLITRGLTNLEIAEDTGLQEAEVEKLRVHKKQ